MVLFGCSLGLVYGFFRGGLGLGIFDEIGLRFSCDLFIYNLFRVGKGFV